MTTFKRPITASLLAIPLAISLLSGCSPKASEPANDVQASKKVSASALETQLFSETAVAAMYLNNQLVTIGEQLSLAGQTFDIESEFLDQRGDVIATLNSRNQLVIANQQSKKIAVSDTIPYPLETLCLYQDQGLQVFLLDERHMAHQMLITLDNNTVNLSKIREFPMPPATEYCVADDQSQRLFVSEENIGVWSYNARAESEIVRSPVALVAPFGRLNKNSGPLAINNNRLWIGEGGQAQLHSLSLNDFSDMQSYQLDNSIAIDTLSVSHYEQQQQLFLLNDHSGELLQASLKDTVDDSSKENLTINRIINIAPTAETQPVTTDGDAADDPAIWVHPNTPEKSRILGTNKKFGLHVYDMQGNTLQTLTSGRVNNVDVRQGFTFKQSAADIASASQRDNNSIALYHIDPNTGVTTAAGEIATTLDEVYGLCMGRGANNEVYVFINDEDGRFEQHQVIDSYTGWSGKLVREFAVKTQPEGCASDDKHQRLFLGEENYGIWALDLSDNSSEPQLIQTLNDAITNNQLHADIEGMDIYHGKGQSYLVVSSQGNDSYVLFDTLPPFAYKGHFRIGMNTSVTPAIDGASETDGLTVSSAYLGPQYPQGLLVVQDGRNLMPEEFQNFKLVSWKDIREGLTLK
ncbi:phytase [Bacterioplanoides sp.]|uniref:phytase n=1 Tax=Bacterioplanoides sp. TaxID=2066072 RepID=UPI003B5A3464